MHKLKPAVVLVSPLYSSNIGATARAMTNMGVERLILVNRQCEIDLAAHQAAASGQSPLENVIEYKNWDEFFAGEPNGIRIGLTARGGRIRQVTKLEEALASIQKHPGVSEGSFSTIYFIFGREDHGLELPDIDQCHFASSLKLFGKNTSLNLAQAVLLTLFVYKNYLDEIPTPIQNHQDGLRVEASNRLSETVLIRWLEALGFNLDNRKMNALTVLKRVLFQNIPTSDEVRVLEAILEQTVRKLTKG